MRLLRRLAASGLVGTALAVPAHAYDLHFRQNGTNFSSEQLRRIFDGALPTAYDKGFPEQRWSIDLFMDAHPDQDLVAITLGLSPRIGPSQALLPVATLSVIEPLPRSQVQWRDRLMELAGRYARLMLANRHRLLSPP